MGVVEMAKSVLRNTVKPESCQEDEMGEPSGFVSM